MPPSTSPNPSPAATASSCKAGSWQRSFETRDGDKRTVVELDVDEIGPSLRYATVKVTKASRSGADSTGGSDQPPF